MCDQIWLRYYNVLSISKFFCVEIPLKTVKT